MGDKAVRVLCCSPNLDLAMLRAAVLKTADCEVVPAETPDEAIDLMKQSHFDVLLVCYEYTQETGKQICDEFKKTNPDGKIVVLRKADDPHACPDVEDVIHALSGPGALIRAVLT